MRGPRETGARQFAAAAGGGGAGTAGWCARVWGEGGKPRPGGGAGGPR